MERTLFPGAGGRARANFGTADLGRPDRLVRPAALSAARPGASFPAAFAPNDHRGFSNLMRRREATPRATLACHFALTRRATNTPDPSSSSTTPSATAPGQSATAAAGASSGLDAVYHSIERQAEHHRSRTFREEYRAFPTRHGIDDDERYVRD